MLTKSIKTNDVFKFEVKKLLADSNQINQIVKSIF